MSNSEVIHKTVTSVEMKFAIIVSSVTSFVVKDLYLQDFQAKIFYWLSQKHILCSLCPKHIHSRASTQACYPLVSLGNEVGESLWSIKSPVFIFLGSGQRDMKQKGCLAIRQESILSCSS